MKIRIGFVSNSSSSSFCLVGVEFDNSDENYEKIFKFFNISKQDIDDYKTEWGYQSDGEVLTELLYMQNKNEIYAVKNHEEHGIKKGKIVIGKYLVRGDVDEIKQESYSFDEIKKIAKELEDFFELDSKIFTGVELC